jgi:hypothetical protein
LLHRLSVLHREELRISGPALSEALGAVMHHSTSTHRATASHQATRTDRDRGRLA